MSETLKLSTTEVEGWLKKETGSIFIPVHERAQKLVDEMRRTLENLTEVSKVLLENSQKEIEKRNMKTYRRARALNKLAHMFLDRTKQIKVPEQVSYDSFNSFVQETQRTFSVIDVDIRNWFSRISPFFILDRRKFLTVFEKAKELNKEMNIFLTREYVKTKTLEDTFQLVNKLKTLETQLQSANEQAKTTENDKAAIEKEIAETQQRITELRAKGAVSLLSQTNAEINRLRAEVKHAFRHLEKPFIKLQALSLHGGGSGLTQEELKKLNQYLENPFEALATEEVNYALTREILMKMQRLMADGRLKLKSDKMRKAEEAIDHMLNKNSLLSLQQKCADAMTRKTKLSKSEEVLATRSDLSKLQELVERLEIRKTSIESERSSIKQTQDDALGKIQNGKDQIENNVLSFLGKKVHIE